MENESNPSDAALLEALGRDLARQRLKLEMKQADLAKQAGVSLRTVVRLEAGASTQLTNLVRVLRVLRLVGKLLELVPPEHQSPLERLRSQRRQRKRAPSGARERETSSPATGWRWGQDR